MRRRSVKQKVMWRRLYKIATVASLVVCIVSVGLLVRSQWVCDHVSWAREGRTFVEVSFVEGSVFVSGVHSDIGRAVEWQAVPRKDWYNGWTFPHAERYGHPSQRVTDAGVASISTSDEGRVFWRRDESSPIYPITEVHFHWGMVVLLTAYLPVIWFVIWSWKSIKRRFRGAAGCCRQCGYDLRATPAVCPECGTAARAAT